MIFVADENIDRQVVELLRAYGHSVSYIAEREPSIPDDQVLELSRQLGAVLITADKDFGELVFRQRLVHSGVLLVRLQGSTPDEKARIVVEAVERYGTELNRDFAVLSARNIRIRRRVGE